MKTTQYSRRNIVFRRLTIWLLCLLLLFISLQSHGVDVTFSIDPDRENEPISPYIYGTNQLLTDTENWTVRRVGGNRTTGYNWETNASNAGEDWYNSSDNYLCSALGVPTGLFETPGDVMTVARYYVQLNPVGFHPGAADVNCDGSIGIIDALLIAQYYVQLISDFC